MGESATLTPAQYFSSVWTLIEQNKISDASAYMHLHWNEILPQLTPEDWNTVEELGEHVARLKYLIDTDPQGMKHIGVT
jgi:hypothetical protein